MSALLRAVGRVVAAGLAAGLATGPVTTAPAAALGTPAVVAETPAPDPFGYATPVLVLLDTSGSMNEVVDGSSGVTRIDAARSAVLDLLTALGTGQPFGLMSYPDTASPTDDQGCERAVSQVTLGPLDVSAAAAAVRTLEPDGDTPTGPAIAQAAQVLRLAYGDRAGGVVVVVSDGEANCGTPPCDVARAVRDSGLDVQFNTIGLNLSDAQSAQLRCVAEVGGGTYLDVADGTDPADAIARASRAAIALDVGLPSTIDVVTGSGAGGTAVEVRVASTGRTSAANVRVSLVVTRSGVGNVTVAHPVRYLGNLATGDVRTVTFTVRPDDEKGGGPVDVSVSALAGNAAPALWTGTTDVTDTLSPNRLGGVLEGVEEVVVLGDSYSAGEGAGTYRTTEPDGNACHRSDSAYGPRLWGAETIVIACSGAVTGDLTGYQHSGSADVPPQLAELRDLVLGDDPPQAVVLSIGGNDARFSSVATECVLGPGCYREMAFLTGQPDMFDAPTTVMLRQGMGIEDDVRAALAKVDATVNDATALAARDGNPIPVVVLPYPRIVPVTGGSGELPGGCAWGISGAELTMLNGFIDAVNGSVILAAHALRAGGRPVYAASPVVDAFQPDHTLCEGTEAYANDIVPAGATKVESLHPNSAGYAAMARALVSWSTTPSAQAVAVHGTPTFDSSWIAEPTPWYVKYLPLQYFAAAGAGGGLHVAATGMAPGSTAVVRLASSPRALTTLTADDEGQVDGWVTVPSGTPPGDHHLQVLGSDADGAPVQVESSVRVLPAGGRGLIVALASGVILLAVSAVVLLRAPRPAARRPRRRTAAS